MEDNPLLKDLNDKQIEAVTTTEGPVLVIAGAGSGKTRVLTHRVAYLIQQHKARPEEILTVTFTNKAADEIKERIKKLLGAQGTSLPWSGTFHSICAKILRIDGIHIKISPDFTIYDPEDQKKLIREAMKKLNINTKTCAPKAALATISSAKNELIDPENFAKNANGYFLETVAKIYPEYQKSLEANQALDFDDLISQTIRLLQTHPQTLKKYQNRFKYILIDEYQDTNYAQYVLVRILSEKHKNLFVVGDDAQSIYKWRGADIRNILNFEQDYNKTKTIKLEQNYRSTQTILEATNQIIRLNTRQKPKKLWTKNEKGDSIIIYNAEDERDEAVAIAEEILDSAEEKNYNDIAVLYRTNAQSRILEEVMLNYGIPYKLVGNVRFYDRKEIKDILAYLRIIVNPADDLSLLRIINTPKRGIGKQTTDSLKSITETKKISILSLLQNFKDHKLEGIFNQGTEEKLKNFYRLYAKLEKTCSELALMDYIKFMLEQTEILEEYRETTDENLARIENIKEFISIAAKYKNEKASGSLSRFLEDISLIEEQAKQSEKSKQPKVTLMTIHSAKGLEFDTIFVAGLEENLFPHSRSYLDPEEMEEERRLAYVAFTRAKKRLHLSFASERTIFGSSQQTMISRFIEELPEELVEYKNSEGSVEFEENTASSKRSPNTTKQNIKNSHPQIQANPGDRVKSDYFGKGTIISVDEDIVKIKFDTAGTKELAAEYAKLEKI